MLAAIGRTRRHARGRLLEEAARVPRPGGIRFVEFTQMAPHDPRFHDYFRFTREGVEVRALYVVLWGRFEGLDRVWLDPREVLGNLFVARRR